MTESNNKTRREDVESVVWSACDIFRGVMDSSIYKDYILTMLFLKYISDTWTANYKEAEELFEGKDAEIESFMKKDRFVLSARSTFQDLYENREHANIGKFINDALQNIEVENKTNLDKVFRNLDFNNEANLGEGRDKIRRLKELLETFNKLDLSPSKVTGDIIGEAYIYLIERFASDAGKKAGEFYTPKEVSELVARLCDPKPGAEICDPACGSGGLLLEAAKFVKAKAKGKGDVFSLAGMEVNGATWALCKMNMFLHDIDSATIEKCNTLTNPALKKGDDFQKFDNIVANPPFSLKNWGAELVEGDPRFHFGMPPPSKGDFAFISHMVYVAKERSGRVAVVVPHGVLFRGGAEGRIRERFIEENLLDAVIGLPENLFLTTSIPVAILIFDRSREVGGENENRKGVVFIEASNDYEVMSNHNKLNEEHRDRIVTAYTDRKNIEKYAHIASPEEIRENEFNLNIVRYVDTSEEEEEIDVNKVEEEILQLEKELVGVREEMKLLLKKVKQ